MHLIGCHVEHVAKLEFQATLPHDSMTLAAHNHNHMLVLVMLQGAVAVFGDLEISHMKTGRLSCLAGKDSAGDPFPTPLFILVLSGFYVIPIEVSQMLEKLGDVGSAQARGIVG